MQHKSSFLLLACGAILPLVPAASAQSSTPAPNVSWGATLSSGAIWTGWAPHDSTANLVDPAIVAGADRLVTAVESQMNQFFDPWHGDDHIGNNSFALNEVLGSALPPPQTGFITSEPQLLIDRACPDGLGNIHDCYILLGRSMRSSDHSAEIAISASSWTGQQEYGTWNSLAFDVSHGHTVYPQKLYVGETDNAVIVSSNMLDWDGNFQFSEVWSIPKAGLYPAGGQRPSYFGLTGLKNADGSPAKAVVPAVSYAGGSFTYLINAYIPPSGQLANQVTLWKIDTTVPTAPKLTYWTVAVDGYGEPPDAEQAGSDVRITTWDSGFTNAVLQTNGLWAVQTSGCTFENDPALRSCVRWYQLNGSSVVQQETYGLAGAYLYFPSIAANSLGDVTVAFNASSADDDVGLYYTGRRASDPLNTLDDFVGLHSGDGCFVRPLGNTNPLAGNTSVTLDLSDGASFWIFGAYAAGSSADCRSNQWGTWLGRVTW
jgi:hypothetical protein